MAGCTTTTLSAFVPDINNPWDRKRILHLYRRMSFGTHVDNVDAQLNKSPSQLVDEIINTAISTPDIVQPEWWDWGYSDYMSRGLTDRIFSDSVSLGYQWVREMVADGFHPRIKMFWINHFVAEFEIVFCSSPMWKYIDVLHRNSMGNFKEFVHEVGITPAMLIYLNGELNNKYEPNENYARELFELFTLGRDQGYVQEDIVEAAKALTGWQVEDCGSTAFDSELYDTGEKTIFGKTDNFDYDKLIDHLFMSKGDLIAKFICRKLYVEFISDDVDEVIVDGLATTFINANWELVPVYRQLFKSEHFFDEKTIGVKVKSPYQLTIGLLSEYDVTLTDELSEDIFWINGEIGQYLLNPPDVAGWKGNRTWVDSSTLAIRWTLVDNYAWYIYNNYPERYRDLAKRISGNSGDVEQIVQSVVEYFLPSGLQTDMAYNSAVVVFKDEVPQNYFEDGTWNLDSQWVPIQMTLLMNHLGRQPEFQLY